MPGRKYLPGGEDFSRCDDPNSRDGSGTVLHSAAKKSGCEAQKPDFPHYDRGLRRSMWAKA